MPHTARHFALASLIVALLAALLFTPGLPGEFVFDDIPNIVNNPSIHLAELNPAALYEVLATKQVSGNLRGLPTLTFALDYWRGGGADPGTFKATNILIHALTAFALAWLFRSVLLMAGQPARRAAWLALVLALAWAAHPLQVSAVLYAVQRLQTMGTLFLVLALLAYLQGRRAQIEGRSGRAGLLGAVLLWAVALGCKEDSVLLPAYTLVLELTVLHFAASDASLTRAWRRGYLLAVLAGVTSYAGMSFIMTATPISMHVHDHHGDAATAWVIQSHLIAMYAPALVSGRLIQRIGIRAGMVAGLALMLACVGIDASGHAVMHYWWGLVLLGVGWNLLFVAGTALLTTTYAPAERYRAQAVNEFAVFGTQALASLLAGPAIHALGWQALNFAAAVPMALFAALLVLGPRPSDRGIRAGSR